ncbi:MAG: LPS export ABC transporter permease LptG [Rhodospirillaceae bacterium]|nr:LPS export ABC transporter permease LptG [Rhodospirillaceae bacterium]|tara:strand:+ start:67696 stop:68793 length:1098 start_codon:yes stop_codon:yes gene_type:complete
MKISLTLSIYLAKQFIYGLLLSSSILFGLVFLIDLVELLRRASGEEINFTTVILMAILKLPIMIQKLLPFVALFGSIFTFAKLSRTNELVVTKAAGVSVWQFLFPSLVISLILGVLFITLLNPLSSLMASKYEWLETKYFRKSSSLLAVSPGGVWLRQVEKDSLSVIHAERVTGQGIDLRNVIIFLYNKNGDKFLKRIDAKVAILKPPLWYLKDVLITSSEKEPVNKAEFNLETNLTKGRIQDSFASPETLSFWTLPGFINILKEAGFTANKHRVYWHSLLSMPLFLFSMVLIAATFSLRLSYNRKGTGILIIGGVMSGFVLYVFSDIIFALGLSGKLPAILAAWTPAGICTLIGFSLLFHLEDG